VTVDRGFDVDWGDDGGELDRVVAGEAADEERADLGEIEDACRLIDFYADLGGAGDPDGDGVVGGGAGDVEGAVVESCREELARFEGVDEVFDRGQRRLRHGRPP